MKLDYRTQTIASLQKHEWWLCRARHLQCLCHFPWSQQPRPNTQNAFLHPVETLHPLRWTDNLWSGIITKW